jgi:DNA-binding transcriptional regulator YdaS (Cro superfamily)
MIEFRKHLQRAIDNKGSQKKLAEEIGCSQQHITWLMNQGRQVTLEMAFDIERVTSGEVKAKDLRPDFFQRASA